MALSGKLYFDGAWHQGEGPVYQAVNPVTGEAVAPLMTSASPRQVELALGAAARAFPVYKNTLPGLRAGFLRACADEILALGDELLDRLTLETGYPRARVEGERARTCGQLNLFASLLEEGAHWEARIDTAQPDRKPLPKPDLRLLNQALGPVAVFGASNFPMAYSVAGGDTASALAAGCPVVVKGHPSHPGSCELVAQAMARAVERCGMPTGVFSLLMDEGHAVGAQLVSAPEIKAVGFTGSLGGGMALYRLASQRPEPIPVFAEMGSINPVILVPETLKQKATEIAQGFVGSLTLGCGQFCVNPGLVLAIAGEGLDQFLASVATAVAEVEAGVMLNARIYEHYQQQSQRLAQSEAVDVVASGKARQSGPGFLGQTHFLRTSASEFLARPELQEEVFGPCSLLVVCESKQQLMQVVAGLGGQLTGTIHATESELASWLDLADLLTTKVGRLVVNGFPTGVEVTHAMVHGGPFPASTDGRFTSVGTAAIARFMRPVCYQNYPQALLPDALKDHNPLGLMRLVNGVKTRDPIR